MNKKHLFEAQQMLKFLGMTIDSHLFVEDNDATENGALEGNLGSDKETESMPLEKDPVLAQDSKMGEIDLNNKEIEDKIGALTAERRSYTRAGESDHPRVRQIDKELGELRKQIKSFDGDPKAELIKYAEATKDPDYIKHVKGLTNMATINARLQWHRQKANDGYNFEEPKKIQEVINKLEKDLKEGKYVDMNYLAGVKRALERAKKERNMKDEKTYQKGEQVKELKRKWEEYIKERPNLPEAEKKKIREYVKERLKAKERVQDSMEMLRLMGIHTQDAYPVVHRDGDFKVVKSDEGFEVYYLGVYYDTFHTKEQALGFIKKFNDRAKTRKKTNDAEEQWITMKGTHVKIEEGQSKAEAAKNFIKKKGGNPAPAKGTAKSETAAPTKPKAATTPKAETKSFQEKGRTGTPKSQSKEELDKWRETLEVEHEISDPDEWDAPASYKKAYAKALAYPPGSTLTDKSGTVRTIEGYMDDDGEGIMVEFEDGSFMDAKLLPSTGNEESLLVKKSTATPEQEKSYEPDYRAYMNERVKHALVNEIRWVKIENNPERQKEAMEVARKLGLEGFDKELAEIANKSKEEVEALEKEYSDKTDEAEEKIKKKYAKVEFDPEWKKKVKKGIRKELKKHDKRGHWSWWLQGGY